MDWVKIVLSVIAIFVLASFGTSFFMERAWKQWGDAFDGLRRNGRADLSSKIATRILQEGRAAKRKHRIFLWIGVATSIVLILYVAIVWLVSP